MKKLSVSHGNIKLGAIPSVSLPPVTTCRAGAPCNKQCYAVKMCHRLPNVKTAYQNNLDLYRDDPWNFEQQLSFAMRFSSCFRMHVSGDIIDTEYLCHVFNACAENPHCKVLMFTKQFEIVNDLLSVTTKPHNLQIIFSVWGDFQPENPHNLPTATVIFPGDTVSNDAKICPGHCAECLCRNMGCWTLEPGENIYFNLH